MEIEGFGASLVGQCVYVCAGADSVWIPWEFVTSRYTGKILVCGTDGTRSILAVGNDWTVLFSPTNSKDWSAIATLLKMLGNTILLAFDVGVEPPSSFLAYVDSLLSDGRIVITRIYCGKQGIPVVPDAILFPYEAQGIYEICARLPAVRNHGPWNPMATTDFNTLLTTATSNKVGVVISDVGESGWTLFWHRIEDSRIDNGAKRFLPALLRCATRLVE